MDSHRHLMLAPDSALRSDMVTDLGMAVLAEGGVPALTPKAVGDRLGCTRQAVHPRDAGTAALVDGVRRQEREEIAGLLAGRVASDPGSDRVAFVHALVEGLRLGLCAAEPTLSPDRALRLVEAATFPSNQLA